jgi:hypothetical protein
MSEAQQYETPLDRAIREATEQGAFDDLPGAGKPLAFKRPGDPDWWLKDLVDREGLSGGDIVGSTVALRREADEFPASLAGLATEDAVRAALEDFNRRVAEDWRRPGTGRGAPIIARPIDVEAMVQAWSDLRASPS